VKRVNTDCVKESQQAKRTNPDKNRHALLLQLSFISPLTCCLLHAPQAKAAAGQHDQHKEAY